MRRFGVCSTAALVAGLLIWGCTADGSSTLDGDKKGSGGDTGSSSSTETSSVDTSSSSSGIDECFGVEEEATPAYENADIIFAIDTSGSMSEESGFVNAEMNNFSQQIIQSGIDVRVIMLAERPIGFVPPFPGFPAPAGICIDVPLGSGNCPDDDNPPHYHHPQSEIGSTDSLEVIHDLFPSYESVLRDDANTYLVIVSDDEFVPNGDIQDAADFVTKFTALAPSKLTGFITHAIYCYDGSGPCEQKGQTYEDLVGLTGGLQENLANQNFQPIFDAVANQVIVNAGQLPCEYLIPQPPMGEDLNPDEVNVVFTDGAGIDEDIYRVDSAAECDDVDGGWYYDNPSAPTKIILCPASCDEVSNDEMGKMDIVFGCATKVPPPE